MGSSIDGKRSEMRAIDNSLYHTIHLEGTDDLVLDIASADARRGADVIVWHESSRPGGAKNQVRPTRHPTSQTC